MNKLAYVKLWYNTLIDNTITFNKMEYTVNDFVLVKGPSIKKDCESSTVEIKIAKRAETDLSEFSFLKMHSTIKGLEEWVPTNELDRYKNLMK